MRSQEPGEDVATEASAEKAVDLGDLARTRHLKEFLKPGLSIYDSRLRLLASFEPDELVVGIPAQGADIQTVFAAGSDWVSGDFGINACLAPVSMQGHIVGYVACTPLDGRTEQDCAATVNEVARSLAERFRIKRVRTLTHRVRREFEKAVSPQEVRDILVGTAKTLFEQVRSVNFATLNRTDKTITLDTPTNEMPAARTLSADDGHVGQVFKTGRSYYEPNLCPEDKHFKRDSGRDLPTTVFTVPTRWGIDDLPGTVQVQSNRVDACSDAEARRAFENLSQWAGATAVKLALQGELRTVRLAHAGHAGWKGQLAEMLLGRDRDIPTIFRTKRSLTKAFAEELRKIAGKHFLGSTVRVLAGANQRSDDDGDAQTYPGELFFAVCVGDGWTTAARETLYAPKTVAGIALNQATPVYINDTRTLPFKPPLAKARTIWAKRYSVRAVVRGVASVSWDVVNACSDDMQHRFEALLTEFEEILDVIAAHEERFFRQLEAAASLASRDELTRLMRTIAQIFDAGQCTLLTDKGIRRELDVHATTQQLDNRIVFYPFGTGISGWVAEHRKSVSLSDYSDKRDLERAARRHGILQPIVPSLQFPKPKAGRSPRGVLAAPLIARDRVIGVIRVDEVPKIDFGHEDEAFLYQIADLLALALDRAWIQLDKEGALQTYARQEAAKRGRLQSPQFDEALKAAVEEAARETAAEGAFIYFRDAETDTLCIEHTGILRGVLPESYDFAIGGAGDFSSDIWTSEAWADYRAALGAAFGPNAREIVKAGALLHILPKVDNVRVGLGVCFRVPPPWHLYPHGQLKGLGESISAALAPALELARAQKKLHDELATRKRLLDIGSMFAGAATTAELAAKVLQTALAEIPEMECGGVVRLYDASNAVWHLAAPIGRQETDRIFPPTLETNRGMNICLQSTEPIARHVDADPDWENDWRELEPGPRRDFLSAVRTWVGIPMRLHNEIVGTILLFSQSGVEVRRETLTHLALLAQSAAAALSSAQAREKQYKHIEPFALIGTMLGGFLHSMRTELTGALGFWDNLNQMGDLPALARERLTRLGESLRALGHVWASASFDPRGRFEQERIALNDLLDETWLSFARTAMIEGITVQTHYDSANPIILGSRIQLETALRMLMQNAVEALAASTSPDRPRVVHLKTKQARSRVILQVADSGCGMSPKSRTLAFSTSFTTKDTGSGLGLAIVRFVANRHRATIRLMSREGKGTAIFLVFPQAQGPHA